MQIKKIFRSGNSLVVSIGMEGRDWLGIQSGDQVMLRCAPNHQLIITKVTKRLQNIAEESEGRDG